MSENTNDRFDQTHRDICCENRNQERILSMIIIISDDFVIDTAGCKIHVAKGFSPISQNDQRLMNPII